MTMKKFHTRARFVVGSLVGGAAIHVALVACSDSGADVLAVDAGRIVDAIADTVSDVLGSNDAHAAPAGTFSQTEVFEVAGSTPHTFEESGTTVTDDYAVQAFPGLSAAEISRRVSFAVRRASAPNANKLPGYSNEVEFEEEALVKDGSAAIRCRDKADFAIMRLLK